VEELDVAVEVVDVAPRDELCVEAPVARRKLGARSVRPVLRDRLLTIVEPGAQLEERARLPVELAGAPVRRGRCAAELRAARERERLHVAPVRADELLHVADARG